MEVKAIDIVFVTFNSSKWVEGCFESYAQSLYPCKKINVIVVDNGSDDDSLAKLEKEKAKGLFASFQILPMGRNSGFGAACNYGASKGSSDIICFFNIDTEVFQESLKILIDDIEKSDDKTAGWELRQFPYEHPKDYDILTGETDWCSAAAFVVRRDVFQEACGFDERLFMYTEDIDLCFRIRSLGYKLKYSPKATIMHYAYNEANEIKPLQYSYSVVNNLLLRYRFGKQRDIREGLKMFYRIITHEGPYKGSRKALFKVFRKQAKYIPSFFFWRFTKARKQRIEPGFIGFDIYKRHREGAYFELKKIAEHPLVSIVIRTHSRPNTLRETLVSLRNQTYDNFEIIIVEDVSPTSQAMIETEFPDLNISYICIEEYAGRSVKGNLGMETAKGEYINFLDDDDLFYADHIETLVQFLTQTEMNAAYSLAFETAIDVKSTDPYVYDVVSCKTQYHQPFNRLLLLRANYIPIQSIMFKKKLFEEYGGIDTELDNQEDYDLWIRYALKTDFGYVEKTTSAYRVPAGVSEKEVRGDTHWAGYEDLRDKIKQYDLNMNAYVAGEEVIRIIEKFEHGE